ncbi:30S ribosomal protein S3 [Candidatus Uhrbacteria bacterium]|nr:30S ribosomal protein S3 [Candidatus Uhrbacteria bacterium]
MGQKVNPKIFRTAVIETWPSKWYANRRSYAGLLRQDVGIRKFLKVRAKESGVARIDVERSTNAVTIVIHTAKPGLIIGRGGQGAEALKKELQERFFAKGVNLQLQIQEMDRPALSSEIVLQSIIADIEKRIPFRRAMKQAIGRMQRAGVQGTKILLSGRLDGAEIARREKMAVGKLPLHTLRARIDYARGAAHTIYGAVGIKVWVYHGEVFQERTADRVQHPENSKRSTLNPDP